MIPGAGEEPFVPASRYKRPHAAFKDTHPQQLLKLREFVANSNLANCGRDDDAVKPHTTRRNCCRRTVPPTPIDEGIAVAASSVPIFSVLAKRCTRTTRLCVLIHPILPGLFAIETCRRSD